MKPNVIQPADPKFCMVCGARLPTVRDEDEGLRCTGTITLTDPNAPEDPTRTVDSVKCTAVYWPVTSSGVVVVTNLVITDANGDHEVVYTNSIVLDAETATEGHLMVLVLAKAIHERDLPPFAKNPETSDRRTGTPDGRLTFSVHRRWKKLYFAGHFAAQAARLPDPS